MKTKKRAYNPENPRNQYLQIRLTKDEKQALDSYCTSQNLSYSDLFRIKMESIISA